MAVSRARRAGLSINPVVFLVAVLLLGVLAWRCWFMLDVLSQTGAYGGGKRVGVIVGTVVLALLSLGVAGGIGAGAYFATKRSDGAANTAMALVLLLVAGWFGYDTYRATTAPRPTPTATSRSLNERVQDSMEAQRRATEQAMERNREAANRQLQALRTPGGQPPAPPERQNQQPTTPPPSRTAPLETGSTLPPSPPPGPSAEELEVERKAKAALAPVRGEIATKTAEFLAAATPLVTALDKSPKATRSELDAREKACTDLKQKATELEAYFRSIDKLAESALKNAGLEFGDQVREQMAFGRSVDGFAKANACGTYERLFDAGLEEAQALKESAGKWRYDAGGQVTSTEMGLQSRLRHLRKGVTQQKNGIAATEATLKQKPAEQAR